MRRVVVTTMIILAVAAIARGAVRRSTLATHVPIIAIRRMTMLQPSQIATAASERNLFTEFRAALKLTNNSFKEIGALPGKQLIDRATEHQSASTTRDPQADCAHQVITLKRLVDRGRIARTNRTEQVVRIKRSNTPTAQSTHHSSV